MWKQTANDNAWPDNIDDLVKQARQEQWEAEHGFDFEDLFDNSIEPEQDPDFEAKLDAWEEWRRQRIAEANEY